MELPELDLEAELVKARNECNTELALRGGEDEGNKYLDTFINKHLKNYDKMRQYF